MTSRLIGLGPIRPPVRPSKVQSRVLQAIDHSVTGSMTAQPASRSTGVLIGWGSYPSAEVQSAYSTPPVIVGFNRNMINSKLTVFAFIYLNNLDLQKRKMEVTK